MPRIRAASIEEHKTKTRREILDATQTLLQEYGYEEMSLGDVAASIGIGRTTFYEYFRDKEDLIASLVEETLPETVEELLARVPPGLSVAERLVDLAEKTVEFVATDPVLGLILHREAPKLSPAAQERVRAAHGDLGTEFAGLYRAGVREGAFRPMPPDLAGRFIQDVIMSAAKALLAERRPERRMEEVTEAMGQFLLHGLTVGR